MNDTHDPLPPFGTLLRTALGGAVAPGDAFALERTAGGVMSDMAIARFAAPPDGLPATVIIKRRKDDEIIRMYDQAANLFQREVAFYSHLGSSMADLVPRCYGTVGVDGVDAGYGPALVLDYIDGVPGRVIDGASPERLANLLERIATVHGRLWMQPAVPLSWTEVDVSPTRIGFPAYAATADCLIPEHVRGVIMSTVVENLATTQRMFARRPWTVTHGDFHLDNVIFTDGGPIFVDWQLCMRSFPGLDVAHMLASSWSADVDAARDDLLHQYLTALARSGGPEWSTETLVDDIAAAALFWIAGLGSACAADLDDTSRARLHKMLEGYLSQVQAWNLLERWPRLVSTG